MSTRNQTKEKKTVSTETVEPNFDVDVDAPQAVETEAAEDTVQAPAEGAKPEEKAKKESTRPPVPEGKVSPVAFAKILSEHLTTKARETNSEAAEIKVAPQVIYSYIKNNGADSKNPFPAEKAEGRAAVVDPQAGIAWWDAKDARVQARQAAKAEKDAKKDEKPAGTEAAPAAPAEVVEAE